MAGARRRRHHAHHGAPGTRRNPRDPRRERRHRALGRGARVGAAAGAAGRRGAGRRPLFSPQAAYPARARPAELRMSALSVRGLRKSYDGAEVVSGVDLAVAAGECFGLLGPNGAGKTTTLKLCLGLIEPDAGEIELLGEPVPRRAREARARVGVVPQLDNLDPDFSVAENLMVYGRYFGIAPREMHARIPGLLEFAGLAGRSDAKISALSGGMKRRLTLARALVNNPQVIFMDEPTTGLDPQARHLIWERLRRLTQEGKTLVLTTHFMEEAERLCHRLAIMDRGRVIAEGTPRALIAEHIEPQVLEV